MIFSDLPLLERLESGIPCRLSDEVLGVLSQSPPERRPMAHEQIGRMLGGYMLSDFPGEPTLLDALECAEHMVTTWSTRDKGPFLRGVADGFSGVKPD